MAKTTIPQLQQMKREGKKIFGVVVWDYQMAQIADKAGADIISVGDTVGITCGDKPTRWKSPWTDDHGDAGRKARHKKRLAECRFPLRPAARRY